jgi:photosystem II stability/assembly factor-like uncharacterized protein
MRFALALGLAAAIAAVVAASARSTSHAVPRGFRPETAAAVGTRDYWVLGEYRCGSSWCNALVRSMDAGGHFARVDLPPLPSQGNVPSLAFASARVGYLVGRGGRLYVTHDGGSSWLLSAPAGVRNVAVGGGDVYVIAGRNRYERSPIARRSWHAVSLPVRFRFLVSLAARGRSVWLLGSTRHIRAGDVDLRSADHGATFTRSHAPCIPELAGKLVPAGDGVVWAVCPTGMMAGLSVSTNGGRTFPAVRSFHDPGGVRLPALTNGAGIFPSSTRAAVLYRGASGPLFRTTDLGRRWTLVRRTGRFEQLYWLNFATSRVGAGLFATRSHANRASFWRTTDGGTTWHSVPIGSEAAR